MRLFSSLLSRIGLAHRSYYHIDETGQRLEGCDIVERRRRRDVLHDLLAEGNIVSGFGSAVTEKRAAGVHRRFDERLTFGEDWELWLRLTEITKSGHC